ncbi:hypothetical protein SLS62_003419 [Diatrype stigma]|uniref:Uncharacterized protein n=1 Tax=Diatrype stigma TaxID=117547 RepID=A0AAN9USW4_9PEZI
MYCYCANFYSASHCHNIVGRFGDRCKLCKEASMKAMNEGRSFRYEFIYPPAANQVDDEYDSEAVADDSGHTSRDERHRNDSGSSADSGDMLASRRERRVTQ